MGEPVKRRSYASALRREQAAQTRARILDAAWALFEGNGYARTTIREVAERAGVAQDTVYAVFGSKPRVLTALIDRRLLAGDSGLANVMERAEALAVRDEPDQRRQIHLFARDIVRVVERVRPVFEIMRSASSVDPEMAGVYREMEGHRLANMRRVARWIAAHGPLRVPVEGAASIIWMLVSPDVARLALDVRGWATDRYSRWLEDTLVRTLLPDRAV